MTKKLKHVAIRNLFTVFKHQSGDEVIAIKVCFTRSLSSMAPRTEFICKNKQSKTSVLMLQKGVYRFTIYKK